MVVLFAVVVVGGLVWLARLGRGAPARTAHAGTALGRVSLADRSAESESLPR